VTVSLFPCKPKDMPWLLASRRVTHLFTYETVIQNYPTAYTILHEAVDPTISIALICRKGASIEPDTWTKENKPLIAAEHVYHVTRFFEQHHIHPSTYHLDRVTGSSEGFLMNTDCYLLADAVVESGRTLQQNDLEIWKVIIPKGHVHIALYSRANS
jgi:ATP phosphoribosyltransferase